jgi:D-alanyl-D-alanine endopeptidase (penicillin-binding protein 7)
MGVDALHALQYTQPENMSKAVVLWSLLAVLLALATGITVWLLWKSPSPAVNPLTAPVAIGTGLVEGSQTPRHFEAASVVLWNTETGHLEFQQDAFVRRPIASLTKLMTAMVALDLGIPWDKSGGINVDEYGLGGNLLLHPGEEVSIRDLFNASLLGSANNATRAYVRLLGVDNAEFVRAMNRKAIALGLEQTQFADVTGLSDRNVSTAYEIARLAEVAWRDYPEIATATAQREYNFTIRTSGRAHTIRNTNMLIHEERLVVTGSKTGYLDSARYCLAVQGSGNAAHLLAVVLGSPSQEMNEADIYTLLTRLIP